MYTLVLITVLWSNHNSQSNHTTIKLGDFLSLGRCNHVAAQTNRTIAVTNTRNVTIVATCVVGG